MTEETKKTPLYDAHVRAGGKMVDFAGWMMPVNYGSQIAEHNAVRNAVGMFDVSHMTIIDVSGGDAAAFLKRVVANNIDKLKDNQALYGALLNEAGGVIDDLIVYRLADQYRCVVNASTRDKVMAWFDQHALGNMQYVEQPEAMIAVQGPQAIATLEKITQADFSDLKPFYCATHGDWLIGRTGYTGEDGVEIMLPADAAEALWDTLVEAGVQPAGLGARDTLRLEAGLNLYGQDLDEQTSPLASNIGWTIGWQPSERDFVGRAAIESQRDQCPQQLTGIVLEDKGILRHGQKVVTDAGEGEVTSGTFSPTLERSIGLARIPADATHAQVDIRGKLKQVKIVQPPFVRRGKILI